MDKQKAAEKLRNRGYDASGTEGIVMVRYPAGKYEQTGKEVRKLLQDIGYDASWGLIADKGSRAIERTSVEETETEDTISTDTTADTDMDGLLSTDLSGQMSLFGQGEWNA